VQTAEFAGAIVETPELILMMLPPASLKRPRDFLRHQQQTGYIEIEMLVEMFRRDAVEGCKIVDPALLTRMSIAQLSARLPAAVAVNYSSSKQAADRVVVQHRNVVREADINARLNGAYGLADVRASAP
jgi:uncharacterized linocin/CFP29 family protein